MSSRSDLLPVVSEPSTPTQQASHCSPWAVSGKLAHHTHIRVERWRRLHPVRYLVGIDRTEADTVADADALSGQTPSRKRTNASCEGYSGGTVSETG